MPGYRAVAKEMEGEIKHSLDEPHFEEIKERDSEEDAQSPSVEIVSDSEVSDEFY
jgi:hypothetical protein